MATINGINSYYRNNMGIVVETSPNVYSIVDSFHQCKDYLVDTLCDDYTFQSPANTPWDKTTNNVAAYLSEKQWENTQKNFHLLQQLEQEANVQVTTLELVTIRDNGVLVLYKGDPRYVNNTLMYSFWLSLLRCMWSENFGETWDTLLTHKLCTSASEDYYQKNYRKWLPRFKPHWKELMLLSYKNRHGNKTAEDSYHEHGYLGINQFIDKLDSDYNTEHEKLYHEAKAILMKDKNAV